MSGDLLSDLLGDLRLDELGRPRGISNRYRHRAELSRVAIDREQGLQLEQPSRLRRIRTEELREL